MIKNLLNLNEDELFYKAYFQASKNSTSLKNFLKTVNLKEAKKRRLIIPELIPETISYQMRDEEYFSADKQKNVFISIHNRYTPAFTHRHIFFEIAYVYSGFCFQNIGEKRIKFSQGDFIFIAPGVYHTMEVFDDKSIIFNILIRKGTFHQVFLPLAKGKDIQSKFFREGLYDAHRIEYLVYHTKDKKKDFIKKIYEEQLINDDYSDQILIGMLIILTADIMRNFQNNMSCAYSRKTIENNKGFAVLAYMQENSESLNLKEMAARLNCSISHCSRLIRNSTGMSFNDWKRVLRIRKAENMLINTKKSINEISLALGYENTETFIRLFRKELHITPKKYREEIQNQQD